VLSNPVGSVVMDWLCGVHVNMSLLDQFLVRS
jgi:hypothetical protein